MITNYDVTGMSCGHCAKAITQEVSALEGVTNVNVNFETKSMSVESEREIDFDAIKNAVDEAGNYQVVKA